jgi:uncharacterized protein involved in exopolysaccharide biosynthesis
VTEVWQMVLLLIILAAVVGAFVWLIIVLIKDWRIERKNKKKK